MLTEDYLIKMINLALAALLRVIGLKKSGDYTEALLLIDMTFEQMLGLRASMVKSLDDDHLYYLLTRNGELDVRRLVILASLFLEEGDIYAAQNRTQESQEDYVRALRYFLEVSFSEDGRAMEDLPEKIAYLLQKVDIPSLGSDTLWPLSIYYEEHGQYAEAEKVLLILIGRDEIRSQIQPEIIAFYQRLLSQSPEALASGGLSMTEIKEKLAHRQASR